MLTLAAAALTLERAHDLNGLAALAALLGFESAALPLDDDARRSLGLPEDVCEARAMQGRHSRRALLVCCTGRRPVREIIARIATRLAARAPEAHWLLLASAASLDEVVIAAWQPRAGATNAVRATPRISALVACRAAIVDSDAETVRALRAAAYAADGDTLVHARWCDTLGREGLSRRFYRTLERVVATVADDVATCTVRVSLESRRELALLQVSRLLFLAFLEAKGWLDGDAAFLANRFADTMRGGGAFHRRVLLPLFFGTLNTPPGKRAHAARAFGRVPYLNGGLFARSPLETRHRHLLFGDESLGIIVGDLLGRFRFTAREDSSTWSEAAIDPEMLGRAFESLMAARERHESGAYFTPQPLVERITHAALAEALGGQVLDADALLRGERPDDPALAAEFRRRLRAIRLLDPACGSGAFLVHALERIASLLALLGDDRAVDVVRREVLSRSIFGVDVNPTAVWLCELRLWLSTVIECEVRDPLDVPPLPNLDHQVRVGDALDAGAFDGATCGRGTRQLTMLRERYARASGARKATVVRALEREERAHAASRVDRELARIAADRRELLGVLRGRDLFGERRQADSAHRLALDTLRSRARELRARRRSIADGDGLPFEFAAHFADVGLAGGFDAVVGNPPWVRLHHIPADRRASLRRTFETFRHAAWSDGAAGARAAHGFASQVDLSALFIERGMSLLRPGGTLALLVPAKLWRSLAGGGVRELLFDRHELLALDDRSESAAGFDAAVYPSIVVARARERQPASSPIAMTTAGTRRASNAPCIHVRRSSGDTCAEWRTAPHRLALDASPGAPWLLVPPDVRAAFERLRASGLRFGATPLAPIVLGAKCGVNDAFVVRVVAQTDTHVRVIGAPIDGGDEPRTACLPRDAVRPLVRGQHVVPWMLASSRDHLIWPVDVRGAPLERLGPELASWLAPWRPRLAARTDARRRGRWWSLFRLDGADATTARVVWPDVARSPRAAVLPRGDCVVPLNSCYVARCPSLPDAYALTAILNSTIASAWLRVIAEPARGGYMRLLAWSVALLPLPLDWPRAVRLLAPIAERAVGGDAPSAEELESAVLRAYRVRLADVEPLLAWERDAVHGG